MEKKTMFHQVKRSIIRAYLIIVSLCIVLLLSGCTVKIHNVTATRQAPGPSANIIQPEFSQNPGTPAQVNVIVQYEHIPADQYLWVAVRVPMVQPNWLVYPQAANGKPQGLIGSGRYETVVGLGGEHDRGQPFNIVVLLLTEAVHQEFSDYIDKCFAGGSCGGIPILDRDVRILDFTTIIRQ